MERKDSIKEIAYNRSASFEYFIGEKFEAGIVLEGSEVKSLRLGNCSLKDAFCLLAGGDILLKNMHIAVYDKAGAFNSKDAKRDRKLLLHKSEIGKIAGQINRRGYTLVPVRLYMRGSLIKVEVALCQGKHTYDKKKSIAERDQKRAVDRELKNYRP